VFVTVISKAVFISKLSFLTNRFHWGFVRLV
jgi:hypothetical protein